MWDPLTNEFDPERILETLVRHGVRFVLIGGIGNVLHGSPYPTYDVDVCPDKSPENLRALARALQELEAREWDPRKDEYVDREWSIEMLEVDDVWILGTRYGRLDLVFAPAGTGGYSDLARRRQTYEVHGSAVPVAALEDIIRSKEAAGRARDREQLPTLRKLLDARNAPNA